MATIDLGAVMDAIAETLTENVTVRVYPWPTDSPQIPCVVIGYPEEIDFDATFNRGSDKATFPLYYMAGKVSDRTARDQLSDIITGATGFKDALDGDLDGAVNSAYVVNCKIQELSVNGVNYLTARFDLEIYA
jgi:hypothetical protein